LNKQILQKSKHLEEVSVFLLPLQVVTVLPREEKLVRRYRMRESLVVNWSKEALVQACYRRQSI
jgi:hypothetical protein